ncbi:hypothetical protein [Mycobacterium sp.]|uniref:hypothetical protein n=1 Tax=Mycobacterium sp. TaxID=1785 RepID=UPI002C837982|nr:hypothetical protein [Mycobacterium sp.]HTQ16406.1 hypothetical protein [Mycobacterium sp.]
MTAATNARPVAPKSQAPLAADLDTALRRLKLTTVRRKAAELLQVAKTQRWTPEEVLRTPVEAEIAARDASNTANRLKAAAFPVAKPPRWVRSHRIHDHPSQLRLSGQSGMDSRPTESSHHTPARRPQVPYAHRLRHPLS